MRMSREGLALLRDLEGYREEAYQDEAGVWTIGYGHTRGVKPGDRCTPRQAEQWLAADVMDAERAVSQLVEVPLAQHQFDALVCFVFNIGVGAFERSTLLDKLNDARYDEVPAEMIRWNKITRGGKKVVSKGLVNRRAAEVLFWSDGGLEPAETNARPVPAEKPTVAEAVKTDTGKGAVAVASTVAAAGAALQAAAPHLEVVERLIRTAPLVLALVAAVAVVGVLVWRARRD